jgi:predicted MFS family arabinose efflux permease
LALSALPPLPLCTLLRIVQGVCMSSAFALTLAYLGERLDGRNAAVAFAAYITGNVASNLVGRLLSAGVADHLGLSANFLVFAGLNIAGALLVYCTVPSAPRRMDPAPVMTGSRLATHWRDPRQVAGFAIGFCLLFAFIGTFTFVNFVLARPPLALTMMQIGASYFVFLPAIFTTPLAGTAVRRFGARPAMWAGLAVALAGLPLLLSDTVSVVRTGMVLVAVGTFFAQAIATGYVSRVAESDKGGASGIYLASYFLGGMTGSIVLGQLFDRIGWSACVMGIGGALLAACVLTRQLRTVAPLASSIATT